MPRPGAGALARRRLRYHSRVRLSRPGSRAAVSAALAALLALGCGRPEEAARLDRPAEAPSGTIVISNLTDITGVNPLIAGQTEFQYDIGELVFQRLLRERADFDQGPPTFAPALAESWEFSEDGRRLTFKLREGLAWSDGAPLTAEDVRFTWQAQTHPAVAWAFATAKRAIADVEAVDSRTAIFHFSETYPTQLVDANEGVILPRHVWGERPFEEWRDDAGWFTERMVAAGPFRLAAWRPAEEIVLEANGRYWKPGLPRLERVVFRIVPDKGAQVNGLLGGTIDYVQQVPPDQEERLAASPGVEVDEVRTRRYDYLAWNERLPIFAEPEVRRALATAIDRQTLVDAVLRGHGRVAVSPVLTWLWAFDDTLAPLPFDPEAARAALAAAGFAAGGDGVLARGGERLAFELLAGSGFRPHLDAATMIQEQLGRIGVAVRIRSLEHNTYVDALLSHEYEAAIGSWNIDTSLDLAYAFHSAGDYNFIGYANPEVDRLIDESKLENDLESKRRLLHRLQRILHEEQPYAMLWEPLHLNGRNRRLRDTRPTVLSSFANLDEWRLAD